MPFICIIFFYAVEHKYRVQECTRYNWLYRVLRDSTSPSNSTEDFFLNINECNANNMLRAYRM